MRLLVSDMAGRASIELKGRELGFDLSEDRELVTAVTDRVKELEARGFTFEAADASFELLLAEMVEGVRPSYFEVESWRVITETQPGGEAVSEATVKLKAEGVRYVVTGEGNGPVNALDQALRTAIGQAFPEVAKFELIDYKVRILDQGHGTDAITRVLIETSDGESSWVTVGVGHNVIEASWGALVDGLTFGLRRHHVGVIRSRRIRRTRSGTSPATDAGRHRVARVRADLLVEDRQLERGHQRRRPAARCRRARRARRAGSGRGWPRTSTPRRSGSRRRSRRCGSGRRA